MNEIVKALLDQEKPRYSGVELRISCIRERKAIVKEREQLP
ncbi:MAG: hypothetical protein OQK82_02985 [Candidatus Pacearchaeota archaeon]|nr:hypothetical protein [Candidatus Pacearchaeota archaeon]